MSVTKQRMTPNQIEIDAARSEISQLATYLQEHLGQKVAAYLSGLRDPKMVGRWAKGRVKPRDAASLRLRNGYHATRLIAEAFGDETAKAWFFGSSRQLGGEAPAFVLRCAQRPEDATPVVLAASSFAESGHGAARRDRTADEAGEAREAHRLAGLLVKEIELYEHDRDGAGARHPAHAIKKVLTDNPRPLAERLRVLDLARDEIAERLGKVVEDVKSDLSARAGA